MMSLRKSKRHQIEFTNIQDRFYFLADKVENILSMASEASTSNDDIRSANSGSLSLVKKRKIKLSPYRHSMVILRFGYFLRTPSAT